MKRFLLIAALALLALPTFAATGSSTVSWARPTTYTDNSPLAAAAISGNKILCTFTPTGGTAVPCTLSANTAPGAAQSFTATLTYPASGGAACFQVIATANGIDSAPSPIAAGACKTFDPLPPSPPGNVTVTVTLAFTLTSASPITVAMAAPVVTKSP